MLLDRQILRKITLISGIVFLLILGFFLIIHYLNNKKDLLNFKISKGYISLKKVDYKFFKKGVLAYEIFSKGLNYRSQKEEVIKLNGVNAYIYGKNKKPAYIITGKFGRLNTVSKNIIISGDVIIKYARGVRMKTNMIRFFVKENKIIAPGYMEIRGKNYFISGKMLIIYIKKGIFILRKDVHFISYKHNNKNSGEITG